jgi:hypothetical protein
LSPFWSLQAEPVDCAALPMPTITNLPRAA